MAKPGAREPDWLGRGTGLVVFFVGIILLVVVFVLTNTTLQAGTVPRGANADWASYGIDLGLRFGRLFLMGFVAGLIAGRGAQMYAAANPSSGD